MESTALQPKVKAIYRAVIALFVEGADLSSLTVSEIAGKAGIGKGTVYEYFKNKEDMIAGALFYQMKECCENLYEQIRQEEDLYDKIDKLLVNMEKDMTEISLFIRALNVMTANSTVSERLRVIWRERGEKEVPVIDLMRRILEDEIGADGEINEKDRDYLVMTVMSRLVCYSIYQFGAEGRVRMDREFVRERICLDVCRDVERMKEGGVS